MALIIAVLWGVGWKNEAAEFLERWKDRSKHVDNLYESLDNSRSELCKTENDRNDWRERYFAAVEQHKLLDNCPEIQELKDKLACTENKLSGALEEIEHATQGRTEAEQELNDLENKIKFAKALYRPVAVRGPAGETGPQGPAGRDAVGI